MESTLDASVMVEFKNDDDDVVVILKGIALDSGELERKGAHNKKRDVNKIRSETIDHLLKLLNERFKSVKELIETISPFINLDKLNCNIEKVHQLVAPDVDVTSLYL